MTRAHTNTPARNGDVSFWVQDAGGTPTRRPALGGSIDVDVAIVGAGMTGLWTAYYLKKASPELAIAVIEREFAGFGASGRNGGWMSAEPVGQFRRYARSRGVEAARAMHTAMFGAMDHATEAARLEGFDAAISRTGLVHFATNPAQLQRAQATVQQLHSEGWTDSDVYELSASELEDRVHIEGALGGYGTPHGVRVHPAKFVFGLAQAVERLGVRIYEGTTATAVGPHRVTTDRGEIRAGTVVEALEGYTLSLAGRRRRLLPMNSSMLVTEPLSSDQLLAIGWSGSELLGDVAHSFTYMQKTADSRIAIGGRGVPYNFASSFDRNGRTAAFAVESLEARLVQLFPALRGVRVDHTWSGVLGVPRDWCAAVVHDRTTGLARAGGYVGHGVSGTNLAGRTLRDLIIGEDSDLTRLPWVGRTARNWEIEPLRWIGATALYAAYRAADRREYVGQKPRTHALAVLADRVAGR